MERFGPRLLQVGADLDVMARDAYGMRGDGPTVFAQGEPN